ncbi:MAG: RNB domain-containing ribonuclease, partial [Rubrivivax sp.]|nr:RNB domain-containing ribonuclease [Rubrivivax sp.]
AELAFAFRLARALKAQRETVRGKAENFNRPDYSFRLQRVDGATGEPDGSEAVHIGTRRRGAPLDLIVAEAMILANSHWGGWLQECGLPGIYRSQASMAPGVKVRMGTKALPHAGMGVAQYTWATSPLRRYVDLVNQWQIIACARHGRTAALVAPFRPKDAALFSIISAFDAAHAAYSDFQHAIERFWTLRWVEQNSVAEFDASVMKDGLVRVDTLPLVLRAAGTEGLPRGSRVRVRLVSADLLTLDVHGALVTRLDEVVARAEAAADALAADQGDEGDDDGGTGELTLAIDLEDAAAAPAADAAP